MPFHCFSQGDVQIIVVQAQPEETICAADLFPNIDTNELMTEFDRIPEFYGESENDLRFTQNICIVQIDGKKILVDTGIPTDNADALLISGMSEAGVGVGEIDFVILTHRDMDHIGGTVNKGKPTFPNARYVIGATEYEDYKIDPVRTHFGTYIAPIEEASQLDILEDDGLVVPGVQLKLTPGHRSGATSVLVNNEILITADVWHCASQVTYPEWQIKWDSDPVIAVQTRKAVIDFAEELNLLVSVPHTSFFGFGRIGRESGKQVWISSLEI